MLDWLDRLIGMANDGLPEDSRTLVRLAIVSVLIAIIWLGAATSMFGGVIAWAPALVFASLALAALVVANVRTMTVNHEVPRHATGRSDDQVPPGYHLGCRIGRRRLECGLLQVTGVTVGLPEAGQVAPVQDPDDVVYGQAANGRFSRHEMYEKICDALHRQIDRAADRNITIASIGIAVPGGVLPEHAQFAGAVGGVAFQANEFVSQRIADDLIRRCGIGRLEQVFAVTDAESFKRIIHLDNDARCAARWLVTEQGAGWTDFACVFAGTGVGSGLVFNRHVFYGAKFRAGEVGHVNLDLGDRLYLDGLTLLPRRCSCGKHGYHFESLVGIGGMAHLAEVLDSDSFTAVQEAYLAVPEHAAALRGLPADTHDARGRILLNLLRTPDDPPLGPKAADARIQQFLTRVAEVYGQLFSVGIAAILNALDLPHFALCGTIPEFLEGNQDFQRAFKMHLAEELMGAYTPPQYGSMLKWGWRGAALLPRDPGYWQRRFPPNGDVQESGRLLPRPRGRPPARRRSRSAISGARSLTPPARSCCTAASSTSRPTAAWTGTRTS
jgi:ROK family